MSARADAQVPAVPDDVDDPRHEKASGVVVLPSHIDWSGDPRRYDLDDPQRTSTGAWLGSSTVGVAR